MADSTCWSVGCSNYGNSTFFCDDDHGDTPRGGQRGSEAGCYS